MSRRASADKVRLVAVVTETRGFVVRETRQRGRQRNQRHAAAEGRAEVPRQGSLPKSARSPGRVRAVTRSAGIGSSAGTGRCGHSHRRVDERLRANISSGSALSRPLGLKAEDVGAGTLQHWRKQVQSGAVGTRIWTAGSQLDAVIVTSSMAGRIETSGIRSKACFLRTRKMASQYNGGIGHARDGKILQHQDRNFIALLTVPGRPLHSDDLEAAKRALLHSLSS